MIGYELINHTQSVWRARLPALWPKQAAKLGSIASPVRA
jgi:hypothetical protein